MPIVMDLGFGEDGDAGDRGTVSKQATRETRFTQVQAPGGKPYSCLSALDYGGTESYRGAQIRSGVEVCMRKYESRDLGRSLLAFI